MIQIENNDVVGVEEGISPEWLELYDVLQGLSVAECFPFLEEDVADEVERLVKDRSRILTQCKELSRLIPASAAKNKADAENAIRAIEAKIVKQVKYNVRIKP